MMYIYRKKDALAWAVWINTMTWHIYATFSTRYSMSIKSARRYAERLLNSLEKYYPGARLFWVAEPFDLKEGYHLHAIVYMGDTIESPEKNTRNIISAWEAVSGGKGGKKSNYTYLEPYNRNEGGNFYLTKYMLKPNADYDILGEVKPEGEDQQPTF